MIVVGGLVFVIIAVLVGFSMAGGHIGALLHPSEIVTIGGASLGAAIVMSPKKVLADLARGVLQAVKGTPYGKATYTELFELLYELTRTARREGILALDAHVSNPEESALFQKYPRIYKNHHALEFLCTALTMSLDAKAEDSNLADALEEEIRVIEREHHAAVSVLAKTADALPGFGIVAAVLGIVVTMQAIDGPAAEIGHKVGAALVGTFLGILASYGFFAPLAGRMEFLGEAELTFFRSISAAVLAMTAGENAREVVMRSRRVVGTDCRPTQTELTQIFKEA
jgi:chemotaxis protein MotA